MSQDIGCRRCGVARDHKPAENEHLAERRGHALKHFKDTGNPGLATRRRFCNRFHHFIASAWSETCTYCSLTGKLRCEPRGGFRRIAQRSSAVRTIDIIYPNHTLALRTARTQLVAAARAEVESRLDGTPTLRADAAARLPQQEVKNDAQSVGNNNGHNRPKRRAHPASFRVTVDIADEQQKAAPTNAGQ